MNSKVWASVRPVTQNPALKTSLRVGVKVHDIFQ